MACNALGTDDLTQHLRQFLKALVAEFLGVFFLVLIGCGSCLQWTGAPPLEVSIVQIALAFGVTVATLVQCIGHVSGGHINPAVTCAMLVTNRIRVIRAVCYVVSQCLGAITGAAVLRAVSPGDPNTVGLGMTTVNEKISGPEGFAVEFLITFVLIFTVFGVCDDNRNDVKGSAPLAIGLAVATCHLFAVKYTGSSMNPARTFGPAVITGIWEHHWVYWLGPCLGGVAAGVLYHYVFQAPEPQSPLPTQASVPLLTKELNDKEPKEVVTERTTAM